tara:strand:- start:6809 stop:7294 length:486 start_codon:yes stop_codon:yes gene_type:complete
MNGFFLYNYLGIREKDVLNETIKPENFLVKELGLDDTQQEKLKALGEEHHQRMRGLSDELRGLKDELFLGLSDTSLKSINKDSIAGLIGEKESAKDLEVLRYFEQVQELCNDKQKEKFSEIIKDALRRGGRDQGPPRGERSEANRPPHIGFDGNRPPPPEH